MHQTLQNLRVQTTKRNLSRFLLVAFLLAIGLTPGFSQASGSLAELRGQVTDATGAIIPNAKVTLTDTAKGTSRNVVTDAEGNYIFIGLLPSQYEMKVEAAGFTANTSRLELTVGQQANVPIKLSTGPVEAQVDIVAGTEVVDTQRTEQAST
ncbi:MAG: carboxypeptidase-like regulatory domain-containing protein, partial [Blastocatellia bacterium]